MGTQLVKFFLSYLGLFLGIALVLALMVVFGRSRLDSFINEKPLMTAGMVAMLVLFVSFMFFKLQDIFIVFSPAPGTAAIAKQELLARLANAFDKPVNGEKLFDVKIEESRAIITWSSSISYFQGTSGGRTGKKRVVVLTLDEPGKVAYCLMKDKDWNWSVSGNYAQFSLNYATGLSAEFVTEVHPSIVFGPNGLTIDMKRLTYDSRELFLPIQTAVLSSGWMLRGGMLPSTAHRLILCGGISLLVFLLLAPLMKLGKTPPGTAARKPAAVQAKAADDYRKQQIESYERVLPQLTTDQIYRNGIASFLTMPDKHFTGEYADMFTAYARAYLKRPDRNEEFVPAIREFAARHTINLGK